MFIAHSYMSFRTEWMYTEQNYIYTSHFCFQIYFFSFVFCCVFVVSIWSVNVVQPDSNEGYALETLGNNIKQIILRGHLKLFFI